MSVLLTVFLAALLVLVGLVLLVALFPFDIEGRASVHDAQPELAAGIDWAWGLLGMRWSSGRDATLRMFGLRIWRFSVAKERGEPKKAEERKKDGTRSKQGASGRDRFRAVLSHRPALLGMLGRLGRTLRLRLRVDGIVGTGDPADTAQLFAVVRAMSAIPGVEIALEFDWLDEELELDVRGTGRVWVAQMLLVAVALLRTRENRQALKAVWATAG